ncbi:MAG: spore coat protein U domain-containing protein [Xanthomonadaceae bacterium]|nr:spore coat protein U domain-containing protein [Xanthomonadaceae bacterium]
MRIKYVVKGLSLFLILLSWLSNLAFSLTWNCEINHPTPTLNFGNQTSFTIGTKLLSVNSSSAGLLCDLPKLSFIVKHEINVTGMFTSGAQPALVKSGGDPADRVFYKLYVDKDKNADVEVRHGVEVDLNKSSSIISGKEDVIVPAYADILPQSVNLSAGVYTDTVLMKWSWRLCTAGILSCIGWKKGEGESTITINLIVTEDCKISASDINFGSAPVTAAFSDVEGTINIICTKGTFYSAGLSKGDNFSGSRRMKSGSNFIDYEIYKGNQAHEVWGNQGSERRDSASADENPGAGWGGTKAQRFNYRAKILPNQPNKPAGTYIDHIMIDVEF